MYIEVDNGQHYADDWLFTIFADAADRSVSCSKTVRRAFYMYANTALTYFVFNDPGKSIALFENLVHMQLTIDGFGRMHIVLSYLHLNDAVRVIYDKGQEQTANKDYSCLVQSFTSYLRMYESMKGGHVE